jgi:hypothetical protein
LVASKDIYISIYLPKVYIEAQASFAQYDTYELLCKLEV